MLLKLVAENSERGTRNNLTSMTSVHFRPWILSRFSCLSMFSRVLGLFWPGWPHRMAVMVIYRSMQYHELLHHMPGGGGGGVLPYMGYIGMCRCEGYGFQAVYSSVGYINQSVWI